MNLPAFLPFRNPPKIVPPLFLVPQKVFQTHAFLRAFEAGPVAQRSSFLLDETLHRLGVVGAVGFAFSVDEDLHVESGGGQFIQRSVQACPDNTKNCAGSSPLSDSSRKLSRSRIHAGRTPSRLGARCRHTRSFPSSP